MQKIAIHRSYGCFSLYPAALKRYCELQGKECFFYSFSYVNSIEELTPIDKTPDESNSDWNAYDIPNAHLLNKKDRDEHFLTMFIPDIDRTKPELIQVIQEMGNAAGDNLKIVEIPDDVKWIIEEYDGAEWVSEVHRTWS